jgi:hypothetical protein
VNRSSLCSMGLLSLSVNSGLWRVLLIGAMVEMPWVARVAAYHSPDLRDEAQARVSGEENKIGG